MTQRDDTGISIVPHEAGLEPAGPLALVRQESTNNLQASLLMTVAVGTFSVMDAFLKVLSAHYPPLQVTAIRGLSSLPVVIVWVALTGGFGQLIRVRYSLQILRGLLGIAMMAAFAFALQTLPLSAAYSIFFVAPLFITSLAVPFLGERVGWRRWVAIAIGIAAVLFVLRPGTSGINVVAGLAVLLAAFLYAVSAITVRILGRTDSTVSMVFWVMFLMGGGATLLALPSWITIERRHYLVIAGIAVVGSIGQWAITEAFTRGESSFIAPFEYTAIAWGVALDLLVWGELPTGATFTGAGVIIASGLYLIRREHNLEKIRREHSNGRHNEPTGRNSSGGNAESDEP